MPYSKVCDTVRPRVGQCATTRTDLGCEPFVGFLVPRAFSNGFVRKHRTERRPRRIENGLRHLGLGESGGVYIAHRNKVKLTNNAGRELVQKICPTVGNLGVDRFCKALLVGSLRLGKLFFKGTEELRVSDLLAIGQAGEFFQPKVDTNGVNRQASLSAINVDHDVQKPISAPVLGKVRAVPDLAGWERAGIEYPESVSSEPERIAFALEVAPLHWHPTKGLLAPVSQERPVELLAGLGVLLARRINGSRVNAKFLAAAGGEYVDVKPCRPSLPPLESMLLRVVAEVPDVIHRSGLLVEKPVQGFNPVAVDDDHFWRDRYSSMALRTISATESPVDSERAFSRSINCSGRKKFVRFMYPHYTHTKESVKMDNSKPDRVAVALYLPGLKAEVSRGFR